MVSLAREVASRSATAGSESSVLRFQREERAMSDVGRMSVAEPVGKVLADQVGSGHPVALGHRGVSFVDPWTDRRS